MKVTCSGFPALSGISSHNVGSAFTPKSLGILRHNHSSSPACLQAQYSVILLISSLVADSMFNRIACWKIENARARLSRKLFI